MATETNVLMGVVSENPEKEEKDIEKLLLGFLHSLMEEQRLQFPSPVGTADLNTHSREIK